MDFEIPLTAPEGYSYEYTEHNTRLIAIWLRHHKVYDYNLGKPTKTVWGFYNSKKREYFAPINSSKPGERVNIQNTTPYTAMPIQLTTLEKCFVC